MEGNIDEKKSIIFETNYSKTKEKIFLFEVSEEFLAQLQNEESFLIKNNANENCSILLTSNSTFKLKRNEYSNSVYLCERKASSNFELLSQNQSLLTLQKINPNKNSIYSYMRSNHLVDENNEISKVKGISKKEANSNLGISSQEFEDFMNESHCVFFDEHYFWVDEKYRIFIFHEILLKWAENFAESKINETTILPFYNSHFQQYCFEIILSTIKKFATIKNESQEDLKFSINYICIASFLAEEILLTKENYFFDEFLEIFDKMIALYTPKSLSLEYSEDQLNQIKKSSFADLAILIDSNNYSSTLAQEQRILIQHIDKFQLSFEFGERLKTLYSWKKKYFYEELVHWLAPTILDKHKISETILKNTRVIYEKLSKNNLEFFKKHYPNFIGNIIEDKLNPNILTIKFYISKF